jgi:hypothetical protein
VTLGALEKKAKKVIKLEEVYRQERLYVKKQKEEALLEKKDFAEE